MSDSGSGEAERQADAQPEAFEAHFQPEAFKPALQALGFSPTSENLGTIRDWLMPCLDQWFSGSVVKKPSRAERITKMKKLRDALALVRDASHPRDIAASLPWTLGDVSSGADEDFVATVRRLHQGVEQRLHDLAATPDRRGRRSKNTFRDFIPDLIWVYEGVTAREARKPHWLRHSGIFGGDFYRFAVAVWECLRQRLPQFKDALPDSEGALGQSLRKHWPKRTRLQGKNSA
jgi:hypothetical protein